LHKLLEPLQSIRMTVQLLHETNINVSLVQLKSDLSSHKSPATKPVLKLTKQILGKWREIYEQHKHMHKKLRPVVQSWRQAVESDHAQGIGVELQQFVELINARGLCRHVVRELGLEELINESRKVYARHNEQPADAFEDLHVRILNAPEELQV
jgi:arsenate reductase-like glutaredoxin family protein